MKKYISLILLFITLLEYSSGFAINNNKKLNNIYDYNRYLLNTKNNDADKKYCINCKYFLSQNIYKDVSKYGKCRKFIKEDIILDKSARSCISPIYEDDYFVNNDKNKYSLSDYFELCVNMRKNEYKCGFDGKFYEN